MWQKHERFSKKLKYMPVLKLHNFSTLLFLFYAIEKWGFNFETTGIPILYVELRCERAFSESYMAVSLVDVTKFACESQEFYRPFYVISKNCLRTRKEC